MGTALLPPLARADKALWRFGDGGRNGGRNGGRRAAGSPHERHVKLKPLPHR